MRRAPQPLEGICDPAAGTCGFLVNAWRHLLETHTDPRDITYDDEGYTHGLTGSKLKKEECEFSQTEALTGFLAHLQKQIAPLQKDRLEHHAIIHRLKFEEVVSKEPDKARATREKAEAELTELQSRMTPLQVEINQVTRQFWVSGDQVKANKYDLSASRYRPVERDAACGYSSIEGGTAARIPLNVSFAR